MPASSPGPGAGGLGGAGGGGGPGGLSCSQYALNCLGLQTASELLWCALQHERQSFSVAKEASGQTAFIVAFVHAAGAGTNAVEQAKPLAKPVTLDTNRVVVLPFKTIGTSGETADLGYGLVSTLTSKLQPLQNLVVIAKESARKYEDTKLSPKEIGQALGAGTKRKR